MLSVNKAVLKIIVALFPVLLALSPAGMETATAADLEGEVTTGVLNVRSGPGKTYRVVGKLLKGARVTVLQEAPEWLKISHDNVGGYVWRRHVRLMAIAPPEPDTLVRTDGDPGKSEALPLTDASAVSTPETAPPPFDTSGPSEDPDHLKQEADVIDNRIAQHQEQLSTYSDREARLIDELDALERDLNRTKIEVKRRRSDIADIESSLAETESELARLKDDIAILDVYAAKRLVALYKLHQLGKVPVLASADSIFDLLKRKNALGKILAADKAVWDELTTKKNRSETLRVSLADQKQQHADTLDTLNVQLAAMKGQSRDRSDLLNEIRGKKSLMLAAIDKLKEAAFALDKQVEGGTWEIHPAGGVNEEENKKPFQTLKGLLQPPVPGKITAFYGMTRSGTLLSASIRNGIDIEAEPGEPIRAVHGGAVIYADWFKGYGNLIIIDHGNSYCTIYAHAEEIFKSEGSSVDTDEVIGTVGDSGSLAGTKLYFEIRHEGKPIDPLAWLDGN